MGSQVVAQKCMNPHAAHAQHNLYFAGIQFPKLSSLYNTAGAKVRSLQESHKIIHEL